MRNKYRESIEEYIASYKVQLEFVPKYKKVMNPELVRFQNQIYDMNPVYFTLTGKIELLEKLLEDFGVKK